MEAAPPGSPVLDTSELVSSAPLRPSPLQPGYPSQTSPFGGALQAQNARKRFSLAKCLPSLSLSACRMGVW